MNKLSKKKQKALGEAVKIIQEYKKAEHMSKFEEKIKEVLLQKANFYDASHQRGCRIYQTHVLKDAGCTCNRDKLMNEDISQLKALFVEEMEKVIGEDECYSYIEYKERNELRSEQRQKLSDLINTIEEKVSPLT